jgi:hypothetical protein
VTLVRAQIAHWAADDVPADYCTHTVFHEVGSGIVWGSVDWDNHANELRDLFFGIDTTDGGFQEYSARKGEVKLYDMGDALPRPIKATATHTPGAPNTADKYGPSQVALVLAFYADRNIKGQRGHIYIGPFTVGKTGQHIPDAGTMTDVLNLGHGLFDIGGQNVAHVLYSRQHALTHVLSDYWVDNRWDTQRRRLPKPSSRVTLHP